jgi:hypothetical protein
MSDMDDIPNEIIEAANAVLAEILTEASYIVAESGRLITIDEAIAKAICNVANDPDGTLH